MGGGDRFLDDLGGARKIIWVEPKALLKSATRQPGLDGRKMSKSYGKTISIREAPEEVVRLVRTMPTDPARVRRTDPGNPANCPLWHFHQVYSDQATNDWAVYGCKSAGIGFLHSKQPVIDAILR